jgi:hypothetical protein
LKKAKITDGDIRMTAKEAKRAYNLQQWSEIIKARNTSGMYVNKWCEENNVSMKSYYYWQRQLRNESLKNLQQRSEVHL